MSLDSWTLITLRVSGIRDIDIDEFRNLVRGDKRDSFLLFDVKNRRILEVPKEAKNGFENCSIRTAIEFIETILEVVKVQKEADEIISKVKQIIVKLT